MIGEIIHGDKRGRELGFPTANLAPDEHDCVPGHGVYAALTNGVPSAVNVGVRPTFQTGRGLLVESFLIDWSGDLYGNRSEIQFLQRLRGERRFDGAEPLIEQMHLDVAQARRDLRRASQPEVRCAARGLRCEIASGILTLLQCLRQKHKQPKSSASSARAPLTPDPPRSRSRCSPSASTTSPSTCASTRRTTTRVAVC